jgi:hypothetical protein
LPNRNFGIQVFGDAELFRRQFKNVFEPVTNGAVAHADFLAAQVARNTVLGLVAQLGRLLSSQCACAPWQS